MRTQLDALAMLLAAFVLQPVVTPASSPEEAQIQETQTSVAACQILGPAGQLASRPTLVPAASATKPTATTAARTGVTTAATTAATIAATTAIVSGPEMYVTQDTFSGEVYRVGSTCA